MNTGSYLSVIFLLMASVLVACEQSQAEVDPTVELEARVTPTLDLDRGLEYIENEQYGLTIDFFNEAIAQDPEDPDTRLNRGLAFWEKGELDKAIADLDQAISLDPQNAEAYRSRGVVHAEIGNIDQAFADYNKSIALDPQLAHAYFNRGNAYKGTGDLRSAIDDWTQAIELDAQLAPSAYFNRGLAYYEMGDLEGAIADFSEAITLDSLLADAHHNRGTAFFDRGDLDLAIGDYTRAIILDPQDAETFSSRGIAYGEKGELDKAIADFDQAIVLDPQRASIYYDRGLAYAKRSDLDRAIDDWSQAITLDPQYALAYYNRGIAYDMKGDNDRAVPDVKRALELGLEAELKRRAEALLGGPVRIEFEPGATRWSAQFEPGEGGVKEFILHASASQAMQVVTQPFHNLSIVGADGVELVGRGTYPMFWRGHLPLTQDYFVKVDLGESGTGGIDDTAKLSVAIAPLGQTSQSFEYLDGENGFGLTYSDYFVVVDRPTLFPPTDGELNLSLLLVGNEYYEATNLSLSYIFVVTNDSSQALPGCGQKLVPHDKFQGEVKVNSIVYRKNTLTEGGLGNIWESTRYSTVHADKCYEIIFLMHSRAIDLYEPGTVTEFDAEGLTAKMQAVFESLVLLDE